MKMKSVCVLLVMLCLFGSSVFAATSITAIESCRTNIEYPDDNRHDSKKLSVDGSEDDGAKSWIKFDISSLVGPMIQATLTVTIHNGDEIANNCDVSVVNDDCLDNIGWDDRTLTWNNAPGNDITSDPDLDPTKTTLITNFPVNGGPGTSFDIDVLAALQADTDNIVQFVLHNSGPTGSINFSTHDHNEQPTWRVKLTAYFTGENLPPVAFAGVDQVVSLGQSGTPGEEQIILDGTTSDDGAYTRQWTQVANGAPTVTISPNNVDDTSVTVTASGAYEFLLTADDTALAAADIVRVYVGDTPCDASHLATGGDYDDDYDDADLNQDCIINLADFAMLAANWFKCDLDPVSSCPY